MRIGIGIIAFKRSFYLRRLLKSLEAQTDLESVDFHQFQDGAINQYSGKIYAQGFEIEQSAKMFDKAKLPNKQMHQRDYNVNVGINSFDAWEYMTERYDYVMMIENDVVLSPHWLRMAKLLYADMPEDVFSFSPGFRRWCDKADSDKHLNSVQAPPTFHFWCECFTPDRWQQIRPLYLDFYEKFIVEQDMMLRDDPAINEWHAEQGHPTRVTTQDAGIQTAIRVNKMRHVCCTVNRAMGIGMQGIHFNQSLFGAFGFSKQTSYIFADDAQRTGFEWL